VRDHRCWHKGRFHAARPVSFAIFLSCRGSVAAIAQQVADGQSPRFTIVA
jgi:hypothetical protein